MNAERKAGEIMRREVIGRKTAELFVRFTDGTGYAMHAVEDTVENRRTLERMAWHLLAKDNVASVDVDIHPGRTAGYTRRNG